MRFPLVLAVALAGVAVVALLATMVGSAGQSTLYVGGGAGTPVALKPTPTASAPPSQFAVYVPPSPAATPTAAPAQAAAPRPAPVTHAAAPAPGGHKKH